MGWNKKMKQLMKILIAAAWLDGIIQPEERVYLRRVAEDFHLAEDPEIKPLLSELRPIQPTECYQWLNEYFGQYPSEADYYQLLEKISGLVYSDGYVDVREAKFMETIQNCDPNSPDYHNSILDKVLRKIQKIYRAAIEQEV